MCTPRLSVTQDSEWSMNESNQNSPGVPTTNAEGGRDPPYQEKAKGTKVEPKT